MSHRIEYFISFIAHLPAQSPAHSGKEEHYVEIKIHIKAIPEFNVKRLSLPLPPSNNGQSK
uniref:Uncharacterized protein n=1 Tax=Candidatus Kentrum sp. LFY TaxID=2126342 RepID=A0A450UF60_9GAMM|nr:MAG: hypothetical protein BECKLFY1418B_GA0070995_102421 [Candidatus Kentron sp. LFY]